LSVVSYPWAIQRFVGVLSDGEAGVPSSRRANLTTGAQIQTLKDTMANIQALVIETQLPLDGAAGRVRLNLTSSKGEPGRFFEFCANECHFGPCLEGLEKARKLHSPLHLHLVFPAPRGRGSEIIAVTGQMKEFMSLEGGEVRTLAHWANGDKAPFKTSAGAFSGRVGSRPRRADEGLHEGAARGRKSRNEPSGRQVAGFTKSVLESGIGSRNENGLALDNLDGFYGTNPNSRRGGKRVMSGLIPTDVPIGETFGPNPGGVRDPRPTRRPTDQNSRLST
jgi:hypothetical protein